MKNMIIKKALAALLTVALLLAFVPASVIPASALTYGDWEYTVSGDKATITGYTGTGVDVVIPDIIDVYPVVGIGEAVFKEKDITSVSFPDSLESIGTEAFYNCESLATVTFGNGLKTIGGGAFSETALTSLTFPDSLESIGKNAFNSCASLASLTLGSGLKSIGDAAFFNDTLIASSLNFSDSLESIGSTAFMNCLNLVSVTFGSSPSASKLKTIGNSAFYYAFNTSTIPAFSVTFPDALESIGYGAFCSCRALAGVFFGSKLKTIGGEAFSYTNVTSVTLPESLESIGNAAFSDCHSLASVTFGGKLKTIGSYAFEDTALTSVTLPESLESIREYAFNDCASFASVTLPFTGDEWTAKGGWDYYGVTDANNTELYAAALTFHEPVFTYDNVPDGVKITGCTNIDEFPDLVIPAKLGGKDVVEISEYAFYQPGITSVTFPYPLETIGKEAFVNCDLLVSVSVPFTKTEWIANGGWDYYGVTYANNPELYSAALTFVIPVPVFTYEDITGGVKITGCTNIDRIEKLVIPAEIDGKTVLEIGVQAFLAKNITSVTFPDSLESIGNYAFYNCDSLASVTFGSSQEAAKLKTIGTSAFAYCGALTSVALPDSLETANSEAFNKCTNLASVTIGSSQSAAKLKAVSNKMFSDTALTSVVLPDAVKNIGSYAFNNCASLASVTFGSGLEDITSYAFKGCAALTSVVFPDSLKSVGNRAFEECASLQSVTFGSSPAAAGTTRIGSYAFNECSALTSVAFPAALKKVGEGAFAASGLTTVSVPYTNKQWKKNGGWGYYGVTDANNTVLYNATLILVIPVPEFTYEDIEGGVRITGCTNIDVIDELVIPAEIDGKTVLEIGESAFEQETIDSVILPDTLLSIGAGA
ncbi:MAG: leucine-rich repeat domain-containing protein, partial [Clostridia bacterium]|nr:leucine-rich repeat domain-containing protein [Clostridia bacterium]